MTDQIRLPRYDRALGVSPSTGGCGFAVFEAGEGLLTWGVAELYSDKDAELLVRIDALVERYRPSTICLESSTETNRRAPARKRLALVSQWARETGLLVRIVSRLDVRTAFGIASGATNHEMASAVAGAFTELEVHLPKKRRLWESERKVLRMFEAVSFAVSASEQQAAAAINYR